ncbi:hypothetical protein U8335_12865 [Roseiconus lacunae]|uniref:hypothetical protein n=1 Tax=Roseiconus lacunae TaxID=2605694 RepID=UPI00308D49CB|nr:hypothetical protein U8335_12865 [Stieleria sp. HD01]
MNARISPSTFRLLAVFVAVGITELWCPLQAQRPVIRRGAVGEMLSSRIRAQATLMDAQSRREANYAIAQKAYAEAAQEMTEALSSGIDLELKAFNAYWEKKRINNLQSWNSLEERIENARKPMVLEKARDVAVWERTIEGKLQRARPSIRSGTLLNRLVQQIDQASGLSSTYSVADSVSANLAKIDEPSLKSLKLVVSSISGPVSVSLSSSLPPIFQQWPYLFRDAAIRSHCYKINETAAGLLSPDVSNLQRYEIEQQLNRQLQEASNAFYQRFPIRPKKTRTMIESQRFHAAEQYLAELERTIASLAEQSGVGGGRPSFFAEYASDDRNAATLVQYMARYGVEFDKAPAGAEFVYDRLFLQLRDLANQINAAPQQDEITDPIINLDLDEMIKDESDGQTGNAR